MSVTYTAFANSNILNIYSLPAADSFDPRNFVVKQATGTQVVFETIFKTLTIRAESTGIFPEVPAIGTSVREIINGSGDSLISAENIYINTFAGD